VATIVTRLLTAVEPDILILGEKDAQQAALLRRIVRDLGFAVEVVTGPTVREADGLALSSRNAYLSPTQRKQAVCLSEALHLAGEVVAGGEREAAAVVAVMRDRIEREPDARIDYLAVVDPDSFQPLEQIGDTARICLAVFIDSIRLIDTQLLSREG
jgi:pantoate--beta-alanine ligase